MKHEVEAYEGELKKLREENKKLRGALQVSLEWFFLKEKAVLILSELFEKMGIKEA